ncbi:MAG: DJ-1/PfpI family protein [Planctomycetota bacterium]
MIRRVCAWLFPTFELLDVTGPLGVFATANRLAESSGEPRPYALELVAERAGPVASSAGIELVAARPRASVSELHTLLLPGGVDLGEPLRTTALLWLRACAVRAERVVSVCTGARILAAAGLLDGCRATTHWESCARLAAEHPAVQVEEDVLFVHAGKYWTSAGICAGIDLALALVEQDLGRRQALAVARELVVAFRRSGGQRQYSLQLEAQAQVAPDLRELVDWIATHLEQDLSPEVLASRAGMSERHLRRLFRAELHTTPAGHVEALRVEAARRLLATGVRELERVASAVGFGSTERMRRALRRHGG